MERIIPMKKQSSMKTGTPKRGSVGIVVPKFATEVEEAEYWHRNRQLHAKQFLAAARNGKAKTLTKAKLLERIEASRQLAAPVISLRVPEADLAMAPRQAEKKGLPYQTHIKLLLHETLTAREKRR
jgi:predicted DNA binding CopG/RHH family protein